MRKRVDADVEPPMLSKAFLVSVGNVVLLLFASIVLISTLWPIISLLFGRGQALSSRFYSIIAVPVGVIVMVGLVISPVIKWCQTELRPAVKKLIVPIFLGLISMWILYEVSIFQPVIIIITFLGVIAISSAILRAIEIPPRRWGSHIAHIGIAVLIIGIVFSSNLVFSQQMNLREGSDFEFIAEKGLRLDEFTIDEQSGDYVATIDFKNIDGVFKTIIPLLNYFKNEFCSNDGSIIRKRNIDGGNTPYPFITKITIGKPIYSVDELLMKIGKASHNHSNPSLGNGNPRMASPVYVSIVKISDKYAPVITELNSAFPPRYKRTDLRKQMDFVKEVLK